VVNRNYIRGYNFENKLANELKVKGYTFVTRTAGSHSKFDIIAIDSNILHLIQCKANDLTTGEIKKIKEEMPAIPNVLYVAKSVAYKKNRKVVVEEL